MYPRRRQMHSCDNCKKSKKACNGHAINLQARPATAYPNSDVILPCSYCVKTKKKCGLNKNWSITDAERQSKAISGADDPSALFDTSLDPHSRVPMRDATLGTYFQQQQPLPTIGLEWDPSLDVSNLRLGQNEAAIKGQTVNGLPIYESDSYMHSPPPPSHVTRPLPFHPSQLATQATASFGQSLQTPEEDEDDDSTEPGLLPPSRSQSFTTSNSSISNAPSINPKSLKLAKRKKKRLQHTDYGIDRQQATVLLSPYESSYGLMASCNGHLVAESFLRIYHDVLENHLACLLAEEFCPYVSTPNQQDPHIKDFNSSSEFPLVIDNGSTPDGKGSKPTGHITNQIYHRINDLERAAQKCGLISLTKEQLCLSSRAMSSTIMAYTAQWSQGKRRREPFVSDPDNPSEFINDDEDDDADGFEQHLQSTLWESAKQSIDAALQIDSYKVIFAEIVFGFIQKPILASEPFAHRRPPPNSSTDSFKNLFLEHVKELLNEDASAIYIRRAIRKAHAIKTRFDSFKSSRMHSNFDNNCWLNEEQMGTVALLYWFAVMVDTIFSSMNYLPTIIADEDCQHIQAKDPPSPPPRASSSSVFFPMTVPSGGDPHWQLGMFAKDDPDQPTVVRWPCNPAVAERAIKRAATVKILLFRSVFYLQDAMRRQAGCDIIEHLVMGTMRVYNYWCETHSVLFRDFLADFSNLPARVKTWFPFVNIRWNLALQIFIEMVDLLDSSGRGSELGRLSRSNARTTARMRRDCARELAELAYATTPQFETLENEQLKNMHSAANEGVTLTEPWALLLMKALSQATIYSINILEEDSLSCWQAYGEAEAPYINILWQANACIKALWFLGRRSQSAKNLSVLFTRWVNRITQRNLTKIDYSSSSS